MSTFHPNDLLDLHTHSTASDGTDSPEELVAHAAGLHLKALALTDHDTLDGLEPFFSEAKKHDLCAVGGVEVSTEMDGRKLHMLGLGLMPDKAGPVQTLLVELRSRRSNRNRLLAELLTKQGYPVTLEEVEEQAGGEILARPHFARALVKKRLVGSIKDAFDRLLKDHGPAYVPKVKPEPDLVIDRIRRSGALAVAAHPHTLATDGPEALERRIRTLAEWGLHGIEVWHPEMAPSITAALTRLAKQHGLVLSAGSDYHGRNKTRSHLGRWNNHHRIRSHMVRDLLEQLESRGVFAEQSEEKE